MTRNVTRTSGTNSTTDGESTPSDAEMEERFRLYRLCTCGECGGTGKADHDDLGIGVKTTRRCKECRGEGRALDLVATAGTPEAVGVALVTLGREGEWKECPVGVLDTLGAKNEKWILSPWLPSPRNISDAARTLAHAPRKNPIPSS